MATVGLVTPVRHWANPAGSPHEQPTPVGIAGFLSHNAHLSARLHPGQALDTILLRSGSPPPNQRQRPKSPGRYCALREAGMGQTPVNYRRTQSPTPTPPPSSFMSFVVGDTAHGRPLSPHGRPLSPHGRPLSPFQGSCGNRVSTSCPGTNQKYAAVKQGAPLEVGDGAPYGAKFLAHRQAGSATFPSPRRERSVELRAAQSRGASVELGVGARSSPSKDRGDRSRLVNQYASPPGSAAFAIQRRCASVEAPSGTSPRASVENGDTGPRIARLANPYACPVACHNAMQRQGGSVELGVGARSNTSVELGDAGSRSPSRSFMNPYGCLAGSAAFPLPRRGESVEHGVRGRSRASLEIGDPDSYSPRPVHSGPSGAAPYPVTRRGMPVEIRGSKCIRTTYGYTARDRSVSLEAAVRARSRDTSLEIPVRPAHTISTARRYASPPKCPIQLPNHGISSPRCIGSPMPSTGSPMPTIGQVGSPLPAIGQVGSPMPTVGQVVSPMPTIGQVGSPMPAVGHVGPPMPTVSQACSPMGSIGQVSSAMQSTGSLSAPVAEGAGIPRTVGKVVSPTPPLHSSLTGSGSSIADQYSQSEVASMIGKISMLLQDTAEDRNMLKTRVVHCFKKAASAVGDDQSGSLEEMKKLGLDINGLQLFREYLCANIGVPPTVFGDLEAEYVRFDFDGTGKLKVNAAYKLVKFHLNEFRKELGGAPETVAIPFKSLQVAGYTITKELGAGNQGTAKLAINQVAENFCVKCYKKDRINLGGVQELKEEYEAMQLLHCDLIAGVLEIFQDSHFYYMVGEPYWGGDFMTLKHRARVQGISMTEEWWRRIFRQCFEAIAFMHEQAMIHCDIKEPNVMLKTSDFREPQVVVIDLGVAKAMARSDKSIPHGTPGYVPPEVLETGKWWPKGDIFSMGVCIMQIMTDKLPPPGRRNKDTPGGIFMEGCETVREIFQVTCRREPPFDLMPSEFPVLTQLVHNLLQKDHYKRPRALQVLLDPWFASDEFEDEASEKSRSRSSVLYNVNPKNRFASVGIRGSFLKNFIDDGLSDCSGTPVQQDRSMPTQQPSPTEDSKLCELLQQSPTEELPHTAPGQSLRVENVRTRSSLEEALTEERAKGNVDEWTSGADELPQELTHVQEVSQEIIPNHTSWAAMSGLTVQEVAAPLVSCQDEPQQEVRQAAEPAGPVREAIAGSTSCPDQPPVVVRPAQVCVRGTWPRGVEKPRVQAASDADVAVKLATTSSMVYEDVASQPRSTHAPVAGAVPMPSWSSSVAGMDALRMSDQPWEGSLCSVSQLVLPDGSHLAPNFASHPALPARRVEAKPLSYPGTVLPDAPQSLAAPPRLARVIDVIDMDHDLHRKVSGNRVVRREAFGSPGSAQRLMTVEGEQSV